MGAPISSNLGGRVQYTGLVPILAIVEVPDVLSWNKGNDIDNPSYVSSETGGQTRRLKGNKDNNVTVNFLLDKGEDLPFVQGDKGTVEAFTDIAGPDGGKWTGPVIIGPSTAEVNPGDGSPVSGTILFEGDGALIFVSNV